MFFLRISKTFRFVYAWPTCPESTVGRYHSLYFTVLYYNELLMTLYNDCRQESAKGEAHCQIVQECSTKHMVPKV